MLLQTVAVIGRNAPRAMLQALSGLDGTALDAALAALERAGLWEIAARYLAQAAERAIERTSLVIDVRSQLRLAYMVTGNYVAGVNRLKEARSLARRIGDVERQLRVTLHLSLLHSTFSRIEKAIRAADQARVVAKRHGRKRYVAEADLAASQGMLLRGVARGALSRLML